MVVRCQDFDIAGPRAAWAWSSVSKRRARLASSQMTRMSNSGRTHGTATNRASEGAHRASAMLLQLPKSARFESRFSLWSLKLALYGPWLQIQLSRSRHTRRSIRCRSQGWVSTAFALKLANNSCFPGSLYPSQMDFADSALVTTGIGGPVAANSKVH
jgi:hypothetical protein